LASISIAPAFSNFSTNTSRGKLEFDGSTLGTPLQDFLAGDVDGGFQYAGNTVRHTHENSYGLYVQDSFRATTHLTFNYGLRYDFFGVIGERTICEQHNES